MVAANQGISWRDLKHEGLPENRFNRVAFYHSNGETGKRQHAQSRSARITWDSNSLSPKHCVLRESSPTIAGSARRHRSEFRWPASPLANHH